MELKYRQTVGLLPYSELERLYLHEQGQSDALRAELAAMRVNHPEDACYAANPTQRAKIDAALAKVAEIRVKLGGAGLIDEDLAAVGRALLGQEEAGA